MPTSVEETLLMTGNVDKLLALDPPLLPTGTEDANRVIGLGLTGRRDEARPALATMSRRSDAGVYEPWIRYVSAWLDRRPEDMVFDSSASGPLTVHEDP